MVKKQYHSLLLNLVHFALLLTHSTGRSRRADLWMIFYLDGFRCFPAGVRQPVLLLLFQAEHDPRLRRLRGCGGRVSNGRAGYCLSRLRRRRRRHEEEEEAAVSGLDRRAPAWPRASRPATSQSLQSLSYAVFSSRHAHHSHILTMPKADCFVQYTSSSAAAPSPTCLLPLDAAPRALSSSFSVPFIHSAAVSDSATLFSRVVTLSSFQLSFTARAAFSCPSCARIGLGLFSESSPRPDLR